MWRASHTRFPQRKTLCLLAPGGSGLSRVPCGLRKGSVSPASRGSCQSGVWQGQGIGYAQVWGDYCSSKSVGTTYLNTKDKPIIVSVGFNGTPGYAYLYVNGVWVSGGAMGSMGIQATWTANAVVPPSATYKVLAASTCQYWAELQ